MFDDRNDDGLCGPGESGVAGVLVFVDGRMAASTDEDGRFRFAPVGGGDRIELVFVVSDEWKPLKDPVEIAVPADVAVPLRRAAETRASIKPKSVATTAAGGVLGVAALAVLVFVGFALLTQTAATRSLERAYRQHKSLELEHLQAQTVARRRAELEKSLEEQADDWREIVHQVLADALPSAATDEWVTVTDISASPPHFTAARQEGSEEYVFTVAPELVRRGRLTQRNRVIPLDASLAPTARVEVQAVWQHLMNQHGLERRVLPRQAAWYLVVARRRK